MIGYDPLHTDTKLDFIHSLIHTLIHLFTLSLGGPLTVCLFFWSTTLEDRPLEGGLFNKFDKNQIQRFSNVLEMAT